MGNVADSLKKKIGPLPAWAWALVLAGAVYYYRKRTASSATTATGATDQLPSDTGTILQPGESVVGPDGSLTTAPGGGDGGSGTTGGTDPGTAIDDLANAIIAALAAQTPPPSEGGGPLDVSNMPSSPSTGGTAKRTQKKKAANKQKQAVNKVGKAVQRGAGTLRNPFGGRTAPKKKSSGAKPTANRTVKPRAHTPTVRQRPTTPVVTKPKVTGHPVATHPKAKPKVIAPPPKRGATVAAPRAKVAVKPAPKPVKKRG